MDNKILENIYKEILELKNNTNLVNSKFEQLNIELNTKIDILCNFKPAQQKSQNENTKKKAPFKPVYIKERIKENKDEFIDVLYTQEEYDKCVEEIETKNTKTNKTEKEKLKQVIDLLYKDVINKNDIYKKEATKIHNEFKKKFLEEAETNSVAQSEDS